MTGLVDFVVRRGGRAVDAQQGEARFVSAALRKVLRFASLALIAGVLGSTIMRIMFHFDPMVARATQAIVDDRQLKRIIGDVVTDDVSVYRILKIGDSSQAFAREEYSASVAGSQHGALVTVLVKKSYDDGKPIGEPEIIDVKVRD